MWNSSIIGYVAEQRNSTSGIYNYAALLSTPDIPYDTPIKNCLTRTPQVPSILLMTKT